MMIPVGGYQETNYRIDRQVIMCDNQHDWQVPANVDPTSLDLSWHPDFDESPWIYHFSSKHQASTGVIFAVAGATANKFDQSQCIRVKQDPAGWQVPSWVDVTSVDFDWHPDALSEPYVYHFASQHQQSSGVTYTCPGAAAVKFVDDFKVRSIGDRDRWYIPDSIDPNSVDTTWHPDSLEPPYIYQFGTQWQKTGGAVYTVPGAITVKYCVDFRCVKTSIDDCWYVSDSIKNGIEDFDWTWHPDATDQPYIYEFGTQHQKTGGPEYRMPNTDDRKYVDQIKIKIIGSQAKVIVIDHCDGNLAKAQQQVEGCVEVVKTVRYVSNYLDTLRRIACQCDEEWLWIISSICDYSDFDFTWYPERWQATMLHVFASDGMKFGDTFFMHVPSFRERSRTCKLLEWYDVNFVDHGIKRLPVPVFQHSHDTHVTVVQSHMMSAPITLFTNTDVPGPLPAVNLWRPDVKAVIPLDPSGSRVIVPREVRNKLVAQIYDYPVIDKSHRNMCQCPPMDIVFLSNGEPNADKNWKVLSNHVKGQPNRCVRVDGISGRVRSQHYAAEQAKTDWYFVVPGKLEVIANFDWSYQPDRLQQPKHYVFHALNPVNLLEYGHQAAVLYNKNLVLANTGRGLDFTLDDAHEVVPILSGVARYNIDAWTAWRTAFREVIKLKVSLPDVENAYRLKQWLAVGFGPCGEYSCRGAQDALDFYEEVNGDMSELQKSYEWLWLATYFALKQRFEISGVTKTKF